MSDAVNKRKQANIVMRKIRKEYAEKVLEISRVIQEKLCDLVQIDEEMRLKSEKEGGSSDCHEQNQHLSFDTGYENESTTFDDAQIMIAGVVDSAVELLHMSKKAKLSQE